MIFWILLKELPLVDAEAWRVAEPDEEERCCWEADDGVCEDGDWAADEAEADGDLEAGF